ncbi:MAG: tetratricopeptide repeat protein, partial [Acidobacteria bacterium]|nr:tetratricopeptide repeat protein [Acidobacteriota bacterium]
MDTAGERAAPVQSPGANQALCSSDSPGKVPTLTLLTLGGLEIVWGGRAVTGLDLRKTRALLVYLALTPGRHDRSLLAGLLWGNLPEERARRNLRRALWSLRRHLDPRLLESDRLSVGLSSHVPCQVDALTFEAEIEIAARSRQAGQPAAAVEHLRAAIALYGGDFLAQFHLQGCLEFEQWMMRRRAWYRERALETLAQLVSHHTQRGEYDQAVRYARQQLTLDPWLEEAHRELMRLLALTGQRGAALAQYETCRRLLERELGLEPLEETTALYRQIRDALPQAFMAAELAPCAPPGRGPPELPFKGRGAEHATLVRWWDAARRGRRRLAL